MALDIDPRHVFRDFKQTGNPGSGLHNPVKAEIRALLYDWWRTLMGLAADAGDIDLPNLMIHFTITGGTADAITATPDLPLPEPGTALMSIVTTVPNTGNVTINGKQLLTSSGNQIAPGGLTPGAWLFMDDGSTYRLVSDQASAAIVAAAEQHADDAEAAALAAISAAGANVSMVDSRQAALGINFPPLITYVRTAGYASAGDGGEAIYKKSASEPTHAGKFQSADGAWWELASKTVTPAMFGAKGDGTTDDVTALNDALAVSGRGLTLDWGGPDRVYRITDGLAVTATGDIAWRSNGATIILDSVAPISRVLDVNSAAYHFFCEGRLVINGADKAYQGFVVTNGANAAKPSCRVNGISVKNIYRSGTTFTGGDGIFIQGNYSRIIVDDVHVDTVKMATGAGIPTMYGVTGISLLRNFSPAADTDFISLTNFTVKDVYSEDVAYKMDQDGIRIFHDYNAGAALRPCTAWVSKGRIENAHIRAIKMQTEHCSISDILIFRNSRIYGSGFVGGPEIDLQVGGGHLSNIDCQYEGNAPDRIAQFTPPQVAGRVINPHWTIKGVTIVTYGTTPNFTRLFSIGTSMNGLHDWYSINISDVHLAGPRWTTRILDTNFAVENARYLITLIGIYARDVTGSWVHFAGDEKDTAWVWLTGMGLMKPQSPAVPFFSGTTTERVTAVLTGANVYATPVT